MDTTGAWVIPIKLPADEVVRWELSRLGLTEN